MDLSAPVAWAVRQATERAGTAMPVVYVSICPREAAAYPQRGRLECEGQADLSAALTSALQDVVSSAEAEDRSVSRLRLRLYGAKGTELVTQTFRVSAGNEDEPATGGREGELVAVIRDMRLANRDLLEANRAMAAGAFSLGMEALKANAGLVEAKAELTGALIIAENAHKTGWDDLKEMAAPLLPLIMQRLAAS